MFCPNLGFDISRKTESPLTGFMILKPFTRYRRGDGIKIYVAKIGLEIIL
jgi:hypothetical protein